MEWVPLLEATLEPCGRSDPPARLPEVQVHRLAGGVGSPVFEAGRADGRRVDERHELLDIVDEGAVEEILICCLQGDEIL